MELEEYQTERDISDEDLDTVELDVGMMSILKNRSLRGDEKWFQYYKTLERYLYKRDPTFKPMQFTFEVQEDSSGNLMYVIRPGKPKKNTFIKLLRYAPSLIGPMIGAALSALLR